MPLPVSLQILEHVIVHLPWHQLFQLSASPLPDFAHRVVPDDAVGGVHFRITHRKPALSLLYLRRPLLRRAAGFPHGQLQADVLQEVRPVDAPGLQQDLTVVDDMIGGVDKDPVFPFDFLAVGDMPHVGGYAPGVDIRFPEGAGNLYVAPVSAGNEAEFHLNSRAEIGDVRDAEIFLRVGPPLGETRDIVRDGTLRRQREQDSEAEGQPFQKSGHKCKDNFFLR